MNVDPTYNSTIETTKTNPPVSQMGPTPIEIVNSCLPPSGTIYNQPNQISAPNNRLTQAEFARNISPQYNPNLSQIAPALVPNIACQNYIATQLPVIKTTSSQNRININSLNFPSYDGKELTRFHSVIINCESAFANMNATDLEKYLLLERITEGEARDIVISCDANDATEALETAVAQFYVLQRSV